METKLEVEWKYAGVCSGEQVLDSMYVEEDFTPSKI